MNTTNIVNSGHGESFRTEKSMMLKSSKKKLSTSEHKDSEEPKSIEVEGNSSINMCPSVKRSFTA